MTRDLLPQFLAAYPFQPAVAYFRSVELETLLSIPLPDGLGLDLGCGDGKLTDLYLKHAGSRRLVGVDIDPEETAQADMRGIYTRVHTASGDNIPEPDEAFDFIFSISVLEHIPNVEPVLDEVARLVRPGGHFILTVPNSNMPNFLRGPLLPWIERQRYLAKFDERNAHQYYWNDGSWKEALSRRGFTIEKSIKCLSAPQTRRWETLSRFTGGLLYTFLGKGQERRPIHIQRSLGLRRKESHMPRFLARLIAGLLPLGVRTSEQDAAQGSVSIYQARKQ